MKLLKFLTKQKLQTKLIEYFFLLSPIIKFKVIGESMEPTLQENDFVFLNKFSYLLIPPQINDIIVLKDPINKEKYIIKRIREIKDQKFFVVGDNKNKSTDSNVFGWISKKDILGKVWF